MANPPSLSTSTTTTTTTTTLPQSNNKYSSSSFSPIYQPANSYSYYYSHTPKQQSFNKYLSSIQQQQQQQQQHNTPTISGNNNYTTQHYLTTTTQIPPFSPHSSPSILPPPLDIQQQQHHHHQQQQHPTPRDHDLLALKLESLSLELENLKRRVLEMENDQGRSAWAIKYCRRVLITSNLLLGVWVSISRILMYISKQKKSRLLNVVVPGLGQHEPRNRIALFLLEAISNAARKSWIFFVSSFLLARSTAWKRQLGLSLCTLYSLYLAFFPQYLPWTNYFNVFTSLLYITAVWSTAAKRQPNTTINNLKDLFNLL
eukprot:gene3314-4153_t